MTKRENYLTLRELVADNAELTAFVDHELALLDKKNTKRSAKQTAKQTANAELRNSLYATMAMNGKEVTCSEMADLMGVSVQKLAYQMRALVTEGAVTRDVRKGVAYFSVAKDEDEEEVEEA